MPAPLEFYFDFSSPYGYLAATRVGPLARRFGREVRWHPILLGAAFKATGMAPLPLVPLKGPYSVRDMERSARFMGITLRMPQPFPIATQAPARAVCWVRRKYPEQVEALILALYRAYFVDGIDISAPEATVSCAAGLGLDAAGVRAALADLAIKDELKAEVEAAVGLGVFGSPYLVVDGEPFWGADRLEQAERWLALGGF